MGKILTLTASPSGDLKMKDKFKKAWKNIFKGPNQDLAIKYFTPKELLKEGRGFYYHGKKYIHHSGLNPNQTALKQLTQNQILWLMLVAIILMTALLVNWHLTIVVFIATLSILYFIDLFFNFILICRSFSASPEIKITNQEIQNFNQNDWPSYTIFCPLYKEWRVVPQFVTAMSQLDYPKDKLQVMLLLEEDDKETLDKIQEFELPSYFDVVIVPDSLPKTKPKACNYGLMRATGEFTVIYDAEDVPEPLQLKKAVIAFGKSEAKTKCIQAKLNFYNPHQNMITKAFSAEYSLWFDLVLTGLQSINAPIPLGGTSNHFHTQDLKDLQGWDSFNVTEDCDLGIRIAKKGFQTAIMDSTTLEEANSEAVNWFWQRTRWIKGYIQTYLVHMRSPQDFMQSKSPHILTFQLIVGGKILSMFINPLMWLLTISYFLFRSQLGAAIESFYPSPILYIAVVSLFLGNFLYVYFYIIGCLKRGYFSLVKYFIFIPIYWLAMSVAAWTALYKMFTQPHHWSKTKHGLYLNNNNAVNQAVDLVGRELIEVGRPAFIEIYRQSNKSSANQ